MKYQPDKKFATLVIVPALTDKNGIRGLLQADPHWAVYALADLAPGHFEHCIWLTPGGQSPTLAMLYSAFDTPIFWAQGRPADLGPLAGQLFRSPSLFLQIRPEFAPLIDAHYPSTEFHPMWRMALDLREFRPAPAAPGDRRLTIADLPALETLYDDGRVVGQGPDFFFPSMLESGVFHGTWQGGDLIAVAGTHIASLDESVAAIGNVYTRRDARRLGHAARLTSAVAHDLASSGIRTISLSVRQSNPAAISVYVRLGFRQHCQFFEGKASR